MGSAAGDSARSCCFCCSCRFWFSDLALLMFCAAGLGSRLDPCTCTQHCVNNKTASRLKACYRCVGAVACPAFWIPVCVCVCVFGFPCACVDESVSVLKGFALMPTACFMPLMRHRHFRIDIKIVTLRFRRLAMKCGA